jgi:hypothetical protein
MPVTTYTENPTYSGLQATVQEYLDDETTTVRIPDFIRQFEVKARRALRTSDATATSVGATDANGQVTLPTDFRGVRRASVGGKSLNFITPEDAMERNATQSARTTYAYSIEGRTLTVVPAGVVDVTLVYAQEIPFLSDDNPTNWLLDRHPDAYLYGALAEAEAYGFDDPRLAMWKALANDALGQIIGADQGTEWASAATVPCDPVF